MSGPKLSAAELERLRQEQLERERQEYLRRLKEAQHVYRDAYNKATALKAYAMDSLQKIDVSYSADAKRDIKAILSQLILHEVADDKDPQAYHQAAQKMNEAADKTESALENCLNKYNIRSKADQKLGKADVMHQSFQAFLGTGGDPVDVKKLDFSSNYDEQRLQKILNLVLQHYKWLLMHGKTDAEKKFAKKSLDKLKDIMAKSSDLSKIHDIMSSVQAMINEETDIRRRLSEAAALYDDYVVIATMMDIVPKPPTDFANVQMIKAEIDNLSAQYRKKDEMDYIADQINDAMISLGYGFVTSRVLTRKDRTEMDCSLYQADDETGIAIYTDQSGAVMMRMTVLGNDTDITDDDRDFSFQRQIDFCAGHPDIVEALAQRGVYLKQKSYLEPDKKHTYKVNAGVLGASDKRDADGRTIMKKAKVDRRKRRRANKKKMRAM